MSRDTYVKVATSSSFNAKVMKAGNAAWGAAMRMSAWCGEHLSDGIVPSHVVGAIASPDERAAMLGAGLLVDNEDDTFTLPAFLKWNRTRAEVEAAKDKARRRKQKQRAAGPDGVTRDIGRDDHGTQSNSSSKSPNPRNVTRDIGRDARVTDGGVTPPNTDTDTDTDPSLRSGARASGVSRGSDPSIAELAKHIESHPNICDLVGDAYRQAERWAGGFDMMRPEWLEAAKDAVSRVSESVPVNEQSHRTLERVADAMRTRRRWVSDGSWRRLREQQVAKTEADDPDAKREARLAKERAVAATESVPDAVSPAETLRRAAEAAKRLRGHSRPKATRRQTATREAS